MGHSAKRGGVSFPAQSIINKPSKYESLQYSQIKRVLETEL